MKVDYADASYRPNQFVRFTNKSWNKIGSCRSQRAIPAKALTALGLSCCSKIRRYYTRLHICSSFAIANEVRTARL